MDENKQNNARDVKHASPEERARSTPKTAAESRENTRDRTAELPADEQIARAEKEAAEKAEAANETANQVLDDGSEEAQGKLAVPRVEVMKRGSTKWTNEAGLVEKRLNDAQPNAPIASEEIPDYLKLHQEVLDGADPLEATLKYQGREEEEFAEGNLADAELHPRTAGTGVATAAENVQDGKE
jgi:hypothetical protein